MMVNKIAVLKSNCILDLFLRLLCLFYTMPLEKLCFSWLFLLFYKSSFCLVVLWRRTPKIYFQSQVWIRRERLWVVNKMCSSRGNVKWWFYADLSRGSCSCRCKHAFLISLEKSLWLVELRLFVLYLQNEEVYLDCQVLDPKIASFEVYSYEMWSVDNITIATIVKQTAVIGLESI